MLQQELTHNLERLQPCRELVNQLRIDSFKGAALRRQQAQSQQGSRLVILALSSHTVIS